jgi:acyl dehydratase
VSVAVIAPAAETCDRLIVHTDAEAAELAAARPE